MAWDMRALYYIALAAGRGESEDRQLYEDSIKANENCLNQNFTVLTQKLEELESRLAGLENN